MPTSRKTIGVIGLGSIGLRHAKNLLAMGHAVHGFDPDQERMKLFFESGGHAGATDFSTILEALVIASPSEQHLSDLGKAVGAGKHIFIEKPIATGDANSVKHLVSWSTLETGKVVMVGNNLRFHSCVKKAREWLSARLIGRPLWANFTLAQYNDKYTEDVVLNWGSHELDLARYLLGPCWVKAAVGDREIADIILMHDIGCRTTGHLDYVTKPERREFMIGGTEGVLRINLVARWATIHSPGNIMTHSTLESEAGSFDEDYIAEMHAFIDLIDGKPVPHAATGMDGLAVLELCLEAKKMAGIV